MPVTTKSQTTTSKKPNALVATAVPTKKKVPSKAPTVATKVIKAAAPSLAQKKPVAKTAVKSVLAKKPKLVRDSFTFPEADHALIKQCKKAAITQGRETKKSEVVRAAMQVFHALPLNAQLAAYKKLAVLAVGRPKSL